MFHRVYRLTVFVFIVAALNLSAISQTKGKRDKRVEERSAKPPASVTLVEQPTADFLSGEANVAVRGNQNPVLKLGLSPNGVTIIEFPVADRFFALHPGNSDLVTIDESPTKATDHFMVVRAGSGFASPATMANARRAPITAVADITQIDTAQPAIKLDRKSGDPIRATLDEAAKSPKQFKRWSDPTHGLSLSVSPAQELDKRSQLVVIAVRNMKNTDARILPRQPEISLETLDDNGKPLHIEMVRSLAMNSNGNNNWHRNSRVGLTERPLGNPLAGATQDDPFANAYINFDDVSGATRDAPSQRQQTSRRRKRVIGALLCALLVVLTGVCLWVVNSDRGKTKINLPVKNAGAQQRASGIARNPDDVTAEAIAEVRSAATTATPVTSASPLPANGGITPDTPVMVPITSIGGTVLSPGRESELSPGPGTLNRREFVEIPAGAFGYVMVTDPPQETRGVDADPLAGGDGETLADEELAELLSSGSPEKIRAALPRMSPEMKRLALMVLQER